MKAQWLELGCEIELGNGERLSLPESVVGQVGPGRWIVTIQPADGNTAKVFRNHSAFLNSYASEDEGLYDDAATG